MERSEVKSRSHHDVAHLQPLTNVPTKYQLPGPYGFQDIAWTRFSNSRLLRQGQRSNQGHTLTWHTYTPQPMSLPSINSLHLPATCPPWVKTINRQPLRAVLRAVGLKFRSFFPTPTVGSCNSCHS